jgi:hypothetical protein
MALRRAFRRPTHQSDLLTAPKRERAPTTSPCVATMEQSREAHRSARSHHSPEGPGPRHSAGLSGRRWSGERPDGRRGRHSPRRSCGASHSMTRPDHRACLFIPHSRGRPRGRTCRAGSRPVPQSARGPRHHHRPAPPPRPTAHAGRGPGRGSRPVLAVASSLAAIGEWATDAPGQALAALGTRRDPLSLRQADGVTHEAAAYRVVGWSNKRTTTAGCRWRRRRYPCSSSRSSPAERGRRRPAAFALTSWFSNSTGFSSGL